MGKFNKEIKLLKDKYLFYTRKSDGKKAIANNFMNFARSYEKDPKKASGKLQWFTDRVFGKIKAIATGSTKLSPADRKIFAKELYDLIIKEKKKIDHFLESPFVVKNQSHKPKAHQSGAKIVSKRGLKDKPSTWKDRDKFKGRPMNEEMVDYMFSFYGSKDGIYGKDSWWKKKPLTKANVYNALAYLKVMAPKEFKGYELTNTDSMVREFLRDIIFAYMHGYNVNTLEWMNVILLPVPKRMEAPKNKNSIKKLRAKFTADLPLFQGFSEADWGSYTLEFFIRDYATTLYKARYIVDLALKISPEHKIVAGHILYYIVTLWPNYNWQSYWYYKRSKSKNTRKIPSFGSGKQQSNYRLKGQSVKQFLKRTENVFIKARMVK
jgi:hypothetical protein